MKNISKEKALTEESKYRKIKGKNAKAKLVKKIVFESDENEGHSPEPTASMNSKSEIIVGSWVSVHYQSECGKTVKEYRGQVTAQDARKKTRYSVKFLSKCKGDGHRYIFPETDDIEWIDVGQISAVFSVPDFNGRYFKFTK